MNIETIDHIELAFENCEELVIPAADIRFLYASGLTESIRYSSDMFATSKQAKYFRLSVTNRPAYDRLAKYNDLVDVRLKQRDGKSVYFSVEYVEGAGGNNENQRIDTTPDEIYVHVRPQEARTETLRESEGYPL